MALGLSFALASSARAGAFGSPVNFNACGDLNVAGDAMSDPSTAFVSAETVRQCEQLCKQGGNLCRQSVNDVAACYRRLLGKYRSFGRKNCEVVTDNPQDARQCKQSTNDSIGSSLDEVKAERNSSLGDCGEWTDICQAACSAP